MNTSFYTLKGVSKSTAQKIVKNNLNIGKLSKLNKNDLIAIFSPKEIAEVKEYLIRKTIPKSLKDELYIKNAGVCCVCRKHGEGLNYHHIDENSRNNVIENIAVLCVRDHDRFHRYSNYEDTILTTDVILSSKREWESFVLESKKIDPEVFALITYYGDEFQPHSMRLTVQDYKMNLVFSRFYGLDIKPDLWIEKAYSEVQKYGDIPIKIDEEVATLEYCDCGCENSKYPLWYASSIKKFVNRDWDVVSGAKIITSGYVPAICIQICELENPLITYYIDRVERCMLIIKVHDEHDNFIVEHEYFLDEYENIADQVYDLVYHTLDHWEVLVKVFGHKEHFEKGELIHLQDLFLSQKVWADV